MVHHVRVHTVRGMHKLTEYNDKLTDIIANDYLVCWGNINISITYVYE